MRTNRLLLLVAALSISLATPVAAAPWTRAGDVLRKDEVRSLLPLPEEKLLLVTSGTPRSIVQLDSNGVVLRARDLSRDPLAAATSPKGEAFIVELSISDDYRHGGVRVAKLDQRLERIWASEYITTDGELLSVRGLCGTPDGGVVIGGREGRHAAFLMKIAASGSIAWARRYDASGDDVIEAVTASRTGGVIAAGRSNARPWLMSLSPSGQVLWQRVYGGQYRGLEAVMENDDGSITAAGEPFVVLKVSARGEVIWARQGDPFDRFSVQQLVRGRDGGSIMTVYAKTHTTRGIASVSQAGELEWAKQFAAPDVSLRDDASSDIVALSEGVVFAPAVKDRLLLLSVGADGASACPLAPWSPDFTSVSGAAEAASVDESALSFSTSAWDLQLRDAKYVLHDAPCGATAPAPADVPVSSFRYSAKSADAPKWRGMLSRGDFEGLESEWRDLIQKPWVDDPVHWRVHQFYDAIRDMKADTGEDPDPLVRVWIAARPDSAPAKVALAMLIHQRSWQVRGMDGTLKERDRDEYERLVTSWHTTLASVRGAENDPRYWSEKIAAAGEAGADVAQLVTTALQHVADPQVALEGYNFFRPQWGGAPSDSRTFAERVATLTATAYRDGMYTWIAYQAKIALAPADFEKAGFDWERIQRGARDIIAMSPKWLPSYHRFAWLSWRFGRHDLAKSLFERPELAWYSGADAMWRGRAVYEGARAWALAPEAPPARREMASQPPTPKPANNLVMLPEPSGPRNAAAPLPPVLLTSELVAREHDKARVLPAVLIKTAKGPVMVSAVDGQLTTFVRWTARGAGVSGVIDATKVVSGRHFGMQQVIGLAFSGKPPAALLLDTAPITESDAYVRLLLCIRGETGCVQREIAGTVKALMPMSSGRRSITIAVDAAGLKSSDFGGAIVMTADGRAVLGVVQAYGGMQFPGRPMTMNADEIAMAFPME